MIELNMAKFNVKNPQTGEFEPLDGASQAKVQSDWNQTDNSAEDFIKNKPTIPAAQVNSDWTATSGVAQILNKPTLATVATSGSYNDLSDKPTIPEGVVVDQVYDATSTNAQSGVAVAQAIAKKPGEITTGKQYTIDGKTVTVGAGAEAFNDLINNKAVGTYSHAEGFNTIAEGSISHAEGNGTLASGPQSHAEGNHTKASSANQHVQGKFNVEDTNGTYSFIIGNGIADNARHNAFAVDWNGLIYVNGAATGVDVSAFPSSSDINTAITKANAAAPQATTYTKDEVDTALAAKLNTADVDAALSSTSTNPVQNKVVQAPVARLVDAGAKNMVNPLDACGYLTQGSSFPITVGGVTYTLGADGSITTSGSSTATRTLRIPVTLPAGTYHFGGTPSGGYSSGGRIDIREPGTDTFITTTTDTGNGFFYTFDSATSLDFCIRIAANYAESMTFKPMLCTAEDYAISPEFVPYAPSNRELFEAKADKSIVGLKLVASNTMASSSTYTYAMNKNDFIDSSPYLARSIGTYIISIMPWSTTPNYSLYAVSYTGGAFQYTSIVKIAGQDMSITVENGVISVSGLPSAGGKISIHALQ